MEITPQGRPNAAAAPHNKQSKVDTESEGSSLATASLVSSDLPNIGVANMKAANVRSTTVDGSEI